MVSKRVRLIMEEVAREQHVPSKVVEAVLKGSFKYVADVMRAGDRENAIFKTVDMPGLGVFNTKPSWTAKIQERSAIKRKKQQNGNNV
jgi:hypoxanthine-guanine phosphoribosyltransferase